MFRRSFLVLTTGLAVALATTDSPAQSQQQKSPTPAGAQQQTQPPSSTRDNAPDAANQRQPVSTNPLTAENFVRDVIASNQKEIQLANLAAARGSSNDVKQFGRELVNDHTKALDSLSQYAAKKGITSTATIRTEPQTTTGKAGQGNSPASPNNATARVTPSTSDDAHAAHIRDLTTKSGAEFDRVFIDMMVENHRKGVSLFESQDKAKVGDQELQNFVRDTLPTLRRHLTHAEQLQKTVSTTTPARNQAR